MREEGRHLNYGERPNIFWELEFGLVYPDYLTQLKLIESHSLWYPGEKQEVIDDGNFTHELEQIKGNFLRCINHPYGYPIEGPTGEPNVYFKKGELIRNTSGCVTLKEINRCGGD